jgi:hypothetical protein
MRWAVLVSTLLIACTLPARAAEPAPNESITVVGQRPAPVAPTTSYWVEDAYTDYPLLGPTFAQGLVIWNHADYYNNLGPAVPPIRAMEGMAELGWDIVRLQRNSRLVGRRADTWNVVLEDVKENLQTQIDNARVQGYTRIIVAGQEIGGGLALEAAKFVDGLYGVIAFAPNTGIEWCGRSSHGKLTCPDDQPLDFNAEIILQQTWEQLRLAHPARLFVLFPKDDAEVPHLRGPTAHDILGQRTDLSFLLVDETGGVSTNTGADKPEFDAYASCMNLFLRPDFAPKPGEFHCNADEVPAALAEMGVKSHGGEAWFGYSTRGQTIYLELPASGRGPALYGWGSGANGKTRPGTRAIEVKPAGDVFTASLSPDQTIRGVRIGTQLRVTIDQDDGTRIAVAMHRLPGNS